MACTGERVEHPPKALARTASAEMLATTRPQGEATERQRRPATGSQVRVQALTAALSAQLRRGRKSSTALPRALSLAPPTDLVWRRPRAVSRPQVAPPRRHSTLMLGCSRAPPPQPACLTPAGRELARRAGRETVVGPRCRPARRRAASMQASLSCVSRVCTSFVVDAFGSGMPCVCVCVCLRSLCPQARWRDVGATAHIGKSWSLRSVIFSASDHSRPTRSASRHPKP